MYSKPVLVFIYLRYFLAASNGKGHGMHSPFIFDFITRVLNDRTRYNEYRIVEGLRNHLLGDSRMFVIEDFGAGSAFLKRNQRSIKSIARNAAKSKRYGQLLFRMVRYYKPKHIIELGTSLGITTSYLSLAQPSVALVTMEGATEIAAIAKRNFENLKLQHWLLQEGNFDDTLPAVIRELPAVDFAFIDGNHRLEPTLRYFNQLLEKATNDSIFIFDDIHWSGEMEQAWEAIKKHPSVRCTVDLFFIGIVFFREEFREKQHFSIRF